MSNLLTNNKIMIKYNDMKKMFFQALAVIICLVSCKPANTVVEDPVETGSLSLNIVELADYITVNTKADDGIIDYTDVSNYDVEIIGPTTYKGKYSEFIGTIIELSSGTYTISVTSPDTEPAAFEQPIYRADDTFVIKAGEVTDLQLKCVPYNCKVTIELTENFKKELATYEVVVGNGLGELVWTKNESVDDFGTGKAGYFLPRGLEVKVKGYRSIDNTEATAVYYVKNPQPAEHHIVTIDAKVSGTIGGVTIDVVTDFNEISDDIFIDGLDEPYVDRPDFGDGDDSGSEEEQTKPSIVWEANPFFDPVTIKKGDEISMTIKAPAGIQTFVVEVSPNFKSAVSMIGGKDYIDLINDADTWKPFGLPVGDEVLGATEIVFELTPFIDTLCGVAGGQTVEFTLKASDSNEEEILIDGEYPVVTIIVPAN